MRKKLVIAILTLVAVIPSSIYTGATDMVNSASPQDNAVNVNNEVVFSIPVGDNGIHYEGADNPDMLIWGPPAFTAAPDGTFWIADTPNDHLLRFKSDGALLNKIPIGDFVIGAGDLEVTSETIWILDVASIPPKVVQLNLVGKVMSLHDLPRGLWLEDGLSGIALGTDGSLLVERMGGHAITQLLSPAGVIVLKELGGYEFQGNVYSAHPADMREKDASDGYIMAGDKRIDVSVTNDLGGLSVLHINSDGSFVVQVIELVLNKSFQVDQKVYRYDASRRLIGMARVPLASQYTSVDHGVTIGPDGEVYAMITQPDGAEIQRLSFDTELPQILISPTGKEEQYYREVAFLAETCRERDLITDVAKEYLNNSTYLSSYHINDNAACPDRVKPSYLGNPGYYSSVPYAWNTWETIAQFNSFMGGGTNGYFAGNASESYVSCGRGIDCSGLVSRAWDLGSHTGTCSLENISFELTDRTALQPGDIMNRCSPTPRHTILFDSFAVNGMWGYEATTEFDHDKVVRILRGFTTIADYTPRRYNNVCIKIRLPLILKTEMETNSANPPSNPYPPSDSPFSSTPYPLP